MRLGRSLKAWKGDWNCWKSMEESRPFRLQHWLQNTEKSPGDLRCAVTQTPIKKTPANTGVKKTCNEYTTTTTTTNNNNNNYYYYYYYSLIRAFHISDSRWFFTEVWVTASLRKSPGLFLVFWQFSTMLSFGWSLLVRQPPSPLVPLVIP